MNQTSDSLLQTAMDLHRRGDFASAERVYQQVLTVAPQQPDALHLWGVLASQTGRIRAAIDAMGRAESAHRANPVFHFNFARALADAGEHERAIDRYRRAIGLRTDFAEAYQNLSRLLLDRGRSVEALKVCRTGLQAAGEQPALLLNLAAALAANGHEQEAQAIYSKLAEQEPCWLEPRLQAADLQLQQGDLEGAAATLSSALQIEPNSLAAHNNLGQVWAAHGDVKKALQHYQRALEIDPNNFEVLVNLGNAYKQADQLDQAIAVLERALGIRPDGIEAWHNLGVLYQDEGLSQAALDCFEQALKIDPENATVRAQRSLVLLAQEQFDPGWRDYEFRTKLPCHGVAQLSDIPTWHGESLAGRRLLVLAEQGIGDQILFTNCLRRLSPKPDGVIVSCAERLVPLLSRSFPEMTVVADDPDGRSRIGTFTEKIDYQIPYGSLPHRTLGSSLPSLPSDPLLRAKADRVAYWGDHLRQSQPSMLIGISWRGGGVRKESNRRSTQLSEWHPFFAAAPSCRWVSLQHGDADSQRDQPPNSIRPGFDIHPPIDPLADFDEFAALVAAMDLVITVDNTTAHLAGGLGVPTWLLLPRPATWYWFEDREDSPWYASVRIFRQSRRGDWSGVFDRAAASLAGLAGSA